MNDKSPGVGVDGSSLPSREGSSYPGGFDKQVARRKKRVLGELFGLTQYGVNLVELPPGAWSSQKHRHTHEDELVYVLEGQLQLVTDNGEQPLGVGMVVGFAGGCEVAHHLMNRSDKPARYLEIGTREPMDECHYPDIDLFLAATDGGKVFQHKTGEPY